MDALTHAGRPDATALECQAGQALAWRPGSAGVLSLNSNSLESLNGARCASVSEFDSTRVTKEYGTTHDLRAAVWRPFSELNSP